MATTKPTYGTSNQSITATLNSLANGSARESTAVDNSSNRFADAMVMVKLSANSSGVSSTGTATIYAYGTADGGSTYTDGCDGADGAHTPNGALKILDVVPVDANSDTVEAGPYSIAEAFGGVLPEEWGIVVQNDSGAALNSTGNSAHYQGINFGTT